MPRRKALDDAAELAPGLARRPESVAGDRREDESGQTWDERNRPSSFRIREVDAGRLEAQARELGLSKDALGRALVWAALDALDAGLLELEIDTKQTKVTDKMDRVRIYVKKEARPLWQISPSPPETD
jgi:hypothetical protein